MLPTVGGCSWCSRWGGAHDGVKLMVPTMERCPPRGDSHDGGDACGTHNGEVPMMVGCSW